MTSNIAIIGLAGIFPQARTIKDFWQNIIDKVDCITDVPTSRWNIDDYYSSDPKTPDKTYCRRGGFIPDIDFDPLEFGLPPSILEVTDVSQLLSLVVAKEALQDAGYANANDSIRKRTGVILGVGGGQKLITPLTSRLQYPVWEKVLKSAGLSDLDTQKIIDKIKLAYIPWEENSFPGMLGNVIAGRIANRLDLGGINCVVDAACASSLTSVKIAISELTEHRSDLMIAGGVDTDNSIFMYMSFSKTPAFSKQQQIRPFDAESDGMIIGEGIGMMVLKRLEDAVRDSDRIYAVIKGIGASSDGKYKSIYAPRISGQCLALERAYEDAKFSPSTVGLIEAHGTGTNAGDPTEFSALNQVFAQDNSKKQYIALGSVKSQIGHTKSTAGAASLIKATLALHHKILPATINVSKPNPQLKIEDTPFYLNTETRPWVRSENAHPRRAGVSSFGFGGTNYHVVLEEYENDHHQPYRLHSNHQTIVLFAPTSELLLAKCRECLSNLKSNSGEEFYLEMLHSSRSLSIPSRAARVGFVSTSRSVAEELLQITIDTLEKNKQSENWEHPNGIFYRQKSIKTNGKVVALFPGQGSQYLDMGNELALNFPELRQTYSQMDDLFLSDGLEPVSKIVFPSPVFDESQKDILVETLRRVENAQAAIGAFSMGLYKILLRANFKPDFILGHSFGELSALWASGVLNDKDYLFLVKARGQAMASHLNQNIDLGTMIAVKGDVNNIILIVQSFPKISIANWNSNEQIVLAGNHADINIIQSVLESHDFKVIRLLVSAAFHTHSVSYAQTPFAKALESISLNSPQIPVYSNTTADLYPNDRTTIAQTLIDQIVSPIRFKEEIENVYNAGGYFFIEFGPKNILTNLVKNILADKPHFAVALNPSQNKNSDRSLREALLQLRIAGLDLKDIDPYQLESKITEKNSKDKAKLTILLNGSNYVSEKTKAAFEEALQKKEKVSINNKQTEGKTNHKSSDQDSLNVQENNDFTNVILQNNIDLSDNLEQSTPPTINQSTNRSINQSDKKMAELNETQSESNSFERLMLGFYAHQTELLRVHEQYLKSQEDTARTFLQIMQQQFIQSSREVILPVENNRIIHNSPPTLKPHPTNEQLATTNFSEQSKDTNVIYEQEVPEAVELIPQVVASFPQQSVEVSPSPLVDSLKIHLERMAQSLLDVVSDKTGYPKDILELGMDMEADLGIDSIKRVEILGAMQDIFTDLPPVNPNELAELRTLKQIVEYLAHQVSQKKTVSMN